MGAVGRWAGKHGGLVLLGALLVTAPCLLLLRSMRLETNLLNIFPAGHEAIEDYRYFSENFGVSDMMVVTTSENGSENGAKLGGLTRWLKDSGLFTWVGRETLPDGAPLVMAFPRETSMNTPFCMEVTDKVREYLAEHDVAARLGGAPVVVAEATESTRSDAARTGWIAGVLVLFVLLLTFRDPLLPLAAGIPLAIAIVWGMTLAQLLWGRITVVTAALPTTMVGIGIDYALHLRATQLGSHTHAEHLPWSEVYARVAPPLFVGAVTSAVAFFSLSFARIPALREMGYVGGTMLLLVFALCLLTMPALLDLRDRIGLRGKLFGVRSLTRLAHASATHRPLVFTLFGGASVPLLLAALTVSITVDPMAYADPDIPSIRLHQELTEKINTTTDPILLATPSLSAERRVLGKLRGLVGPGEPFRKVECLSSQSITRDLAPQLQRFVGEDKNLCMILHPRFDPYRDGSSERINELINQIQERGGEDILCISGPPVVYARLLGLVRGDLIRVGLAAAVSVILVLLLLLRRPHYVLPALVPLAGGVIWMLGVLHLSGIRLTAVNVVSAPLVIGLGIDYGVHIVHRLRNGSVEGAVSTTGRAILVASLTTILAFLALCLVRNKAMAGMGLSGAVGITACLVWSIVFLPALLHGSRK